MKRAFKRPQTIVYRACRIVAMRLTYTSAQDFATVLQGSCLQTPANRIYTPSSLLRLLELGKEEVVGGRGEEENVLRGKDRIRGCRLREAFHVFTSLERFEAGERLILGEINLFLERQINVLKIKLKKLEIFVNKSCFYSIRISLLSKLMAEEQRGAERQEIVAQNNYFRSRYTGEGGRLFIEEVRS